MINWNLQKLTDTMKKQSVIFLLVLFLFSGGCSQDYPLHKSVFINDKNDWHLPEYSEWGYNTFGAYMDRKVFISDESDQPGKIIINKDSFNLLLSGRIETKSISLKFTIIGYSPADYSGLISLNNTSVDLTGHTCIVTFNDSNSSQRLNVYEGSLFFKRVQNLYVDKVLNESILSGTFNFKTIIKGEPVTFSYGRFDLGIGTDNFFKF